MFGRKKKKPPVSKPETGVAPKKKRPEGYGTCKFCKVKNGHAGWCPKIS